MDCPACGAAVEKGNDFCLACGEVFGDSALARAMSGVPDDAPSPPVVLTPVPVAAPQAKVVAPRPKKMAAEEEREPVRCLGCGIPTRLDRCPGCGIPIRHGESS